MDSILHAWDQKTVQTKGCQRRVCTKNVPSAGQLMVNNKNFLVDNWEKFGNIASANFSSLFDRLKTELQEKISRRGDEKVFFHHDNSPAHCFELIVELVFNDSPSSNQIGINFTVR